MTTRQRTGAALKAPAKIESRPAESLGQTDFETFRRYLQNATGIALGDQKNYLVTARLTGIARLEGYANLPALIAELVTGRAPDPVKTRVLEAMTTHETFWFRDPDQYSELHQVLLPRWIAAGNTALRAWSAGCSTGEEPYSISLCAEEYFRTAETSRRAQLEVIASDVSRAVIARAGAAVFSSAAVGRGLDSALRQRYFAPQNGAWQLAPAIAGRVKFRALNLLNPFDGLGLFDAIFCRNTLFYFSTETRRDILERMARCLKPGGRLFLGSSETLPPGFTALEPVRGTHCILYAPRGRR